MKTLEYIGKEPFTMVGGITQKVIKEGDMVEFPDARADKWLADKELGKLFKLKEDKKKKKEG